MKLFLNRNKCQQLPPACPDQPCAPSTSSRFDEITEKSLENLRKNQNTRQLEKMPICLINLVMCSTLILLISESWRMTIRKQYLSIYADNISENIPYQYWYQHICRSWKMKVEEAWSNPPAGPCSFSPCFTSRCSCEMSKKYSPIHPCFYVTVYGKTLWQ